MCVCYWPCLKLLLRPTAIILKNILPSPAALPALGSWLQSIMHTFKQKFLPKYWLCPCAWKTKMASYCLWDQDLSLSSNIWCYYMPHLLRKLLFHDYHVGSSWGEKYYSCYKCACAPPMSFLLPLLQIASVTLRSPHPVCNSSPH